MTLTPAAMEVARRHAAEDRDLLARLVREGTVRRQEGRYEATNPASCRPFIADIERRVSPPKNLAIRPKKRRKR